MYLKDIPPKPYFKAKILEDGWLPLPDAVLSMAVLKEGDEVELFVTHSQIIVRRKDYSSDDTNQTASTTAEGPTKG